jgi:hypothetical protein
MTLRFSQWPLSFTTRADWVVETRPATTYDNFARDFGERFVSSYKRPVDLLMNSPFMG